jgi:hypothetical protein
MAEKGHTELPWNACGRCRHWHIDAILSLRGSCCRLHARKYIAGTCENWRPLFREFGDLRHPITKDYRNWLRLMAVRRQFRRGRISSEEIESVAVARVRQPEAETRGALSMWPELSDRFRSLQNGGAE